MLRRADRFRTPVAAETTAIDLIFGRLKGRGEGEGGSTRLQSENVPAGSWGGVDDATLTTPRCKLRLRQMQDLSRYERRRASHTSDARTRASREPRKVGRGGVYARGELRGERRVHTRRNCLLLHRAANYTSPPGERLRSYARERGDVACTPHRGTGLATVLLV